VLVSVVTCLVSCRDEQIMKTHIFRQFSKISGRSLVELMIVLAISMVILIALMSLLATNKQSFRVTDDKARLDEEGRLAINLIAFHLRMAGYGALISAKPIDAAKQATTNFLSPLQLEDYLSAPKMEGVQGCSGGFVDASAVVHNCKNTDAADGIIVRYVVDANNANLNSANLPSDCLGQKVIGNPMVVENRFFVAVNATSMRSELYCAGSGGTVVGDARFAASPQPIVENVSDMRILFGYDSDGDQSVDGFYTAESISALPEPSWSRVISAEICLVMQSANNGLATTNQQYRNCSGTLVLASDKRIYSTFSSVVAVRSRTSGSSL
jgi:type IV pilus assembly protein PilW